MKRGFFLNSAALILSAMPVAANINANANSKLYVCVDPQSADLDLAGFELLTYVEIKGVGSHGEAGSTTNILTYDTWDTAVIQKSKGITDAGSPEIELARLPFDLGQQALRTMDATNFNYAFKMVRNDPQTVGGQATIIYNRGMVTGPRRPFGRNEDFDLEIYVLALNQKEIVVAPTLGGTAPTMTVAPAITGTATVGQTLSLSTGTFTGTATITYERQWYAGGVAIPGAVGATFNLTSEQLGKVITGRVRAANVAGSAIGFSAPTAVVA